MAESRFGGVSPAGCSRGQGRRQNEIRPETAKGQTRRRPAFRLRGLFPVRLVLVRALALSSGQVESESRQNEIADDGEAGVAEHDALARRSARTAAERDHDAEHYDDHGHDDVDDDRLAVGWRR